MASFLSIAGILAKAFAFGFLLLLGLGAVALFVGYQFAESTFKFLTNNWIAQTAFAAWVAFTLQERALKNNHQRQKRDATYHRRIEAIKSLQKLIENRIYASNKYLWTIESDAERIKDERAQYALTVTDWNSNAKTHHITLMVEFGRQYGSIVDRVFYNTFMQLDILLRNQRILAESNAPLQLDISQKIRDHLQDINLETTSFVEALLDKTIAENNIANGEGPITSMDAKDLSYGRLLREIFQPTS